MDFSHYWLVHKLCRAREGRSKPPMISCLHMWHMLKWRGGGSIKSGFLRDIIYGFPLLWSIWFLPIQTLTDKPGTRIFTYIFRYLVRCSAALERPEPERYNTVFSPEFNSNRLRLDIAWRRETRKTLMHSLCILSEQSTTF